MDRYKKRPLNFSSSQDQRIVRAQRRSVDRKSIRDNDLFLRRHMEPLQEEKSRAVVPSHLLQPTFSTSSEAHTKPSRLQLLQKWKAEKEMKKKIEESKKKPVFKVTHVSHSLAANGSSGDFQIKGSAIPRQIPRCNIPAPTPLSRFPRAASMRSKVTVPSLTNDPSTVPKYNQPKATHGLSKTNTPVIPAVTRNAASLRNKTQPKLDKVTPKSRFQKPSDITQKVQTSFIASTSKQKAASLTNLNSCSANRKEKSFAPPNFKFTAPPQMKVYLLDKPISSRKEHLSKLDRNFTNCTKSNTEVKNAALPVDKDVCREQEKNENPQTDNTGTSQSDGQCSNENSSVNCTDKNEASFCRRSSQLLASQKTCEPQLLSKTTKVETVQNLYLKVSSEDLMGSDVYRNLDEKENIQNPSQSLQPTSFNLSKSFEKVSLSTSSKDDKEAEGRKFSNQLQDTLQKMDAFTNGQSHTVENNSSSPCRRSRRILTSQNKNASSFDYSKYSKLPSIDEPEEYCENSEQGYKVTGDESKNNKCSISNDFEKNNSPPIRRSARISSILSMKYLGGSDLNSLPEETSEVRSPVVPHDLPKPNRISLLGTPISVLNRRGRVSVIKDDLITFSPGF